MSLEEEEIANPMQKMRLADERTDATAKQMRYTSIFKDVMDRWGILVDWRLKDPGCLMEHQKEQLVQFKERWKDFQNGRNADLAWSRGCPDVNRKDNFDCARPVSRSKVAARSS